MTRHIALLIIVASLCAPAAAQIFRTVDAEGNVVFSDTPPPPDPAQDVQVEPLSLPQPNTFEPPKRSFEVRDLQGAADPEQPQAVSYSAVRIISPANDEVIRNNAGNVQVLATSAPQLGPGHTLELILDGELIESNTSGSFSLSYVDRGTHQLEARVVDDATGQELARSKPSTFHLQRYAKPPAG